MEYLNLFTRTPIRILLSVNALRTWFLGQQDRDIAFGDGGGPLQPVRSGKEGAVHVCIHIENICYIARGYLHFRVQQRRIERPTLPTPLETESLSTALILQRNATVRRLDLHS